MRAVSLFSLLFLLACGDDDGTIFVDGGPDAGRVDGGGSTVDAGRDAGTMLDAGSDAGELLDAGDFDAGDLDAGDLDAGTDAGDLDAGADAGTDAGDLDAGTDAGADAGPSCIELPIGSDPALVIMGELTATGLTWMRPEEGETDICEMLVDGVYAYEELVFCNVEAGSLACLISHEGIDGDGGTLEDPYLFAYDGAGVPSDRTTCIAENDDDLASDTFDSLLELTVGPGETITVVPSSYEPVAGGDAPGVGTYTVTVVCDSP
jgi:hypothetical protein